MKYFILFIAAILLFTAPAAHAAPCSNPAGDEGDQVYNITYHVMQYCNGSHWVAMGSVMGMGDNLGHHTADQALDMSNFRIENLALPDRRQPRCHTRLRYLGHCRYPRDGDTKPLLRSGNGQCRRQP